jgi:hypothetical protein
MTAKIEGSFWCCASKVRPHEILFHNPLTRTALLMAGSMFYGTYAPLLYKTKRAAKDEADSWNALYDADELRVAPRRIHITIEIDMGKKKEAANAKA